MYDTMFQNLMWSFIVILEIFVVVNKFAAEGNSENYTLKNFIAKNYKTVTSHLVAPWAS